MIQLPGKWRGTCWKWSRNSLLLRWQLRYLCWDIHRRYLPHGHLQAAGTFSIVPATPITRRGPQLNGSPYQQRSNPGSQFSHARLPCSILRSAARFLLFCWYVSHGQVVDRCLVDRSICRCRHGGVSLIFVAFHLLRLMVGALNDCTSVLAALLFPEKNSTWRTLYENTMLPGENELSRGLRRLCRLGSSLGM